MSQPQVEPERARERPPDQTPRAERDKPPEKQPSPQPEQPPAEEPQPEQSPADEPAPEEPPAEEPPPPEQPPAQEPRQEEDPPPETEQPPVEEPDSEEVAKQEYLDQASPLVFNAADTMSQIQQVLNEYLDGTLTEQEAASEIRLLRGDLAGIRAEVEALTPPQALQAFEDHFVTALDFYIQGSDNLASGLEQNDPNLINEAASLFEQGNAEIELATAELEANASALRIRPNSIRVVLVSVNKTMTYKLFIIGFKLLFRQ